MSERGPAYSGEHEEGSELEPVVSVTIGNKDVMLMRDSATLFLHQGPASVFDHAFVEVDGSCIYVFRFHIENFDAVAEFMLRNGYEASVNIAEAAEVDQEAYIRKATRDLRQSKYVPEEWVSREGDV